MPPGPKPLGVRATPQTERQARRYRAAHAANTASTVKVRCRRPATNVAARNSGGMPWPRWSSYRPTTSSGWLDCRKAWRTRPHLTCCGPFATWNCPA